MTNTETLRNLLNEVNEKIEELNDKNCTSASYGAIMIALVIEKHLKLAMVDEFFYQSETIKTA